MDFGWWLVGQNLRTSEKAAPNQLICMHEIKISNHSSLVMGALGELFCIQIALAANKITQQMDYPSLDNMPKQN
jgi:hypothetical protein